VAASGSATFPGGDIFNLVEADSKSSHVAACQKDGPMSDLRHHASIPELWASPSSARGTIFGVTFQRRPPAPDRIILLELLLDEDETLVAALTREDAQALRCGLTHVAYQNLERAAQIREAVEPGSAAQVS
jgi:hypothetical protein